jgi:hypothetical protein
MRTRRHILRLALSAAVAAVLALPAHSLAEYYVPPDNSAANQYTESFPGAGGEKGGKVRGVTPADTLGAGNAKRLEERGPEGKAAAEVATQTAPSQLATGGNSTGSAGANVNGTGTTGGGSGADGGNNGGGNGGLAPSTPVDQPQGSSALGQIVGQATGVGDGNVGLWLPLAIMLILAGSIAYGTRMHHVRHG